MMVSDSTTSTPADASFPEPANIDSVQKLMAVVEAQQKQIEELKQLVPTQQKDQDRDCWPAETSGPRTWDQGWTVGAHSSGWNTWHDWYGHSWNDNYYDNPDASWGRAENAWRSEDTWSEARSSNRRGVPLGRKSGGETGFHSVDAPASVAEDADPADPWFPEYHEKGAM